MPLLKTKDVIYSDQTRMTYSWNNDTQKWNENPAVIIRKKRVDDLNIKSATIRPPPGAPTIPSLLCDIRISCSTEANVHLTDETQIGEFTWKDCKEDAMRDDFQKGQLYTLQSISNRQLLEDLRRTQKA